MHNHPLHRSLFTACLCCKAEQEFVFTSKTDHVICKSCTRHQGDTAAKAILRDADHVGLWRSELALEQERRSHEAARLRGALEERNAEIARLQTLISDLRATLAEGVEKAPLASVERWWTNAQVAEATRKRDHAYRSRDYAFRALWAINRLHHQDETRDGYCSCRRRADSCKELSALTPELSALTRWEKNQIDRIRSGQSHELPDEHPEVLKRRAYRRNPW